MDKTECFINFVAPRSHAKSSIVAGCFAIHHLVEAWENKLGPVVIVLCGKTEGHAKRLLETVKNVLDYSNGFKSFWGYHGMHVAAKWTGEEIVLDTGDVITTRGTNQQVVGLKYLHQRPTLILGDDLEDTNNTKTKESVMVNRKWFMTQLVPTRDVKRGRVIVVGTPQHQEGIVNHLSQQKGWKTLWYSAEVDQEKKTTLWPELYSWDALQELKDTMGPSYYTREYQCKILSDETQLFKEEYLQYYDGSVEYNSIQDIHYLTFSNGKILPVHVFIGIDTASSVSDSADYTVIMPIAVDEQNNRYILPLIRERAVPSKVLDRIVQENKRWVPRHIRMLLGGQEEIYADVLRNLEQENIRLLTTRPKVAKEKLYLEGLEPWFYRKKVFLLHSQGNLRSELLEFTTDGKHRHDDQIDAMYAAFKGSYPPVDVVQTDEEVKNTLSTKYSWQTA
jgi:predicted phage terminase large subunit-like protein